MMRLRIGVRLVGMVVVGLGMMGRVESAEVGRDYEGRAFVTGSAPELRFEARTSPQLRGIDYGFEEQTARGVALFGRFPEFKLSDRRIHVSGPWYDSESANGHFSHGITTIEAMPRFRQGPTDVRRLPYDRKWHLLTDPTWWGHANRLADRLEKADPKDERVAALRTFGRDHRFVRHEGAIRELGRELWRGERMASDAEGKGVMYPSIDIECTEGWEMGLMRDFCGWLYLGMAEEAAKHGVEIVPCTYGQWTFCVGAVGMSPRVGGKGDPEYLLADRDFLAGNDATIRACNENGGMLAMDGYMRAIWGKEPFYKRKADGSPVLVNGEPVFNDVRSTRAYGWTLALEKGEAEHTLRDLYGQATRMYLMHHRRAGQYPAESEMCKGTLRNTKISAWSRFTNEGLEGIEQNDRPLPGWELEMLVGMYLMTADDIVMWSSDFNCEPGGLGADYTKTWKYNAHGVVEYLVKAAHRYSALDGIHRGPFRWCWFSLPMVNNGKTEGDRYIEKPIVIGKLRELGGRTWLELYAAWPGLDGQSAEMVVWVEKGGRRSVEYRIQLADGRSYFYDGWQLPEEMRDLEGRDVYLRFTDPLGKTRTWRGDWRENGRR